MVRRAFGWVGTAGCLFWCMEKVDLRQPAYDTGALAAWGQERHGCTVQGIKGTDAWYKSRQRGMCHRCRSRRRAYLSSGVWTGGMQQTDETLMDFFHGRECHKGRIWEFKAGKWLRLLIPFRTLQAGVNVNIKMYKKWKIKMYILSVNLPLNSTQKVVSYLWACMTDLLLI